MAGFYHERERARSLVRPASVRAFFMSEYFERRLKSSGQFIGRPCSPVVQEVNRGLRAEHVLVDRHNVQTMPAQGFQYRSHFRAKHRDVSRHFGIGIVAVKRRPGVQTHARVDPRTHLGQLQIIAAHRDFIDLPALLAFVPDNLRELGRVEISGRHVRLPAALGTLMFRFSMADQIDSRLHPSR